MWRSLLLRISSAFDPNTEARGLHYVGSGRVQGLVVHGRTAEARVRGTRRVPYLVTVACPISAPRQLRTSCSCPMGQAQIPCKHVYAAVYCLDQRAADLGAQGAMLALEPLDPAEVHRSLGLRAGVVTRSAAHLPDDEADPDSDVDGPSMPEATMGSARAHPRYPSVAPGEPPRSPVRSRRSRAQTESGSLRISPRMASRRVAQRLPISADAEDGWRSRLAWLAGTAWPAPRSASAPALQLAIRTARWLD
ncbi:MAG: SWIM zinc finger family protein, partial [Myxococcales bacterium]|nr:SWIM zinc finger family protein [Myxococcales bacterium]